MENIESGEDQLFCCNSIGPLTNKEAIFNQFMEKRDRIFEVKTLTKDRSKNGYILAFNELLRAPRRNSNKNSETQHSEITVLNTSCELHYLWFDMNLYEIHKSVKSGTLFKYSSIASMHIYHCLTSAFKYLPKWTFAV